jgi:hypothetical protein
MSGSGKFLDYSGPVDYMIIDRLLVDLKKKEEFIRLPKIAGKRVYSILVECLENIAKHSLRDCPPCLRQEPFISAVEIGDKIIITTGNAVREEKKARLVKIIDHINNLGQQDLIRLYEEKINRESKPDENGAELGFIIMRLKSGERVKYDFTDHNNGFSDFEIQISVNKNAMRKLIIEKTTNSPKVILDPERNLFEISGESRPPDVAGFYSEILKWFDDFSAFSGNISDAGEPVVINLDFEYFNSSSAKYILDFCKQIAAARSKGNNILVKWHYEKDDNDMLESGIEMSRIARFPFEYNLKDMD